ncbi:MAG: hypothetical protein J6N20_00275 [Pseudomonas sp.]|nr:hypothetical protein [Pseudomonas sp.]
MTTNQTIDGVSRELLEAAVKADASRGATASELVAGWAAMDRLRALLDAPASASKPFRILVKSCHGPLSRPIEKADESTWADIEGARQYFGAEREVGRDRASRLVSISPGEWFATPLYIQQPAAQAQGEPVAWLLTGSKVWADKVVEVERQADKLIADREDGTRKVALYAEQPALVAVMPDA